MIECMLFTFVGFVGILILIAVNFHVMNLESNSIKAEIEDLKMEIEFLKKII